MSVDQNSGGGGGLPEAVSQAYYRYGLFVATHPIKVILLAVIAFLILSSPLYHLPLPGHVPQEYLTPAHNYSIPPPAEGHISLSPSPTPTPLWYQGAPIAYILQVVIRSSVCPVNDSSLTVSDSYRGPLATVFSLYEALSNYEHGRHKFHSSPSSEGVVRPNKTVAGTWLGSECLLVEDVAKQHRGEGGVGGKLPNFNCLLLSPADLWTRDKNEFLNDPHVLTTIKSLMAGHDDESRVADVLFGVPASEVGLLNNDHPKVVTYALTLALRRYNEEFVEGLRSELLRKYPLHKDNQPSDPNIIHLYFPSRLSLWEVLIFLLYCGLFFSVYFSLLKLDILYSKLGISITVLVTLVSSLCLAVGTCAYWGLKPLHTQGKYVYPVLSGLVGFENSMVLMRSIASTPQHLDVKIRVARGLAREGWIITKYFLTMITLVTLSFFLFIPIVQEICIYGSLVLLCDLSMQLVFFIAVLSLDLQRLRDSQKHLKQEMLLSRGWIRSNFSRLSGRHRTLNLDSALNKRSGIANLHRRITSSRSFPGEDRVAPPSSEPTKAVKDVPKRLRLTYCLTGNRTFQRMFICAFVGWIAFIIYSTTGIIDQWERLAETNPGLESVIRSIKTKSSEKFLLDDGRGNARGDEVSLPTKYNKMKDSKGNKLYNEDLNYENFAEKYQHHDDVLQHEESVVDSADGKSSATNKTHLFKLPEKSQKPWTEVLRHVHPDVSSYLPETHWPTLFGYYNITLRGEYISLLPPLLLSVPVSVEEALMVHHPGDPNTEPWKPQASVHTQSPVSENDWWWVSLMSGDSPPKSSPRLGNRYGSRRTPFIPSSSGEMIVTGILAIPALGVMVYSFIWLYRCICSRHYAEWREQWWTGEHPQARAQIIGECVPVSLVGHSSEIECVCSDGSVVASACLSGVIKTWDPVTSECLATISRTKDVLVHHEDHSSDYESGSPRSLPELPAYAEHPPGCIWQLPSQLNSGAPNETCVQSPSVVSSSPLSIRTDFPAMYGCKKAFPSTITNPDVVDVAAQSFNVGQVDRTFRPEESPQINSQSSVPVPITDPIPVNTGTTIAYGGSNSTTFIHSLSDSRSRKSKPVNDHSSSNLVTLTSTDGFTSLNTSSTQHEQFTNVEEIRNSPGLDFNASSTPRGKERSQKHQIGNINRSLSSPNNLQYPSWVPPLSQSLGSPPSSPQHVQDSSFSPYANTRNTLEPFNRLPHSYTPSLETPNLSHSSTHSLETPNFFLGSHGPTSDAVPHMATAVGPQCVPQPSRTSLPPVSPSYLSTRSSFTQTPPHPPLQNTAKTHRRNLSAGNPPLFVGPSNTNYQVRPASNSTTKDRFGKNSTALAGYSCDGASVGASAVWSLHCHEGIVFVGCADGSIEVWDAYSGNFKFATENSSGSGVTAMTVCSSSTGSRLVAARLSGSIDYYSIDVSYTVPSSCQPHEEEPRAEPPSSLSSTSYRKHRRGSSYENNFPSTISEHRRYVGDDSNLAGGGISGDGIATNGVPTSGIAADGITAPIDNDGYVLQLTRFTTNKAHHQSISVLRSDTSRVITGSLDHTLKVLTCEGDCLFTLHGHLGPVTCATLGDAVGDCRHEGAAVLRMDGPLSIYEDDNYSSVRRRDSTHREVQSTSLEGAIIASGAQDGTLCVWDLATGACVYSVCGHSGAVLSIVTSSSYLISMAADDRLAVWERFQGHLLTTVHLTDTFFGSMIMLTSKLLLTAKQDRLCVWDVSQGTEVLEVSLGDAGHSVCPRHLIAVGASVIFDYGSSLRAVRMPVAEKMD